MNRIPKIIPPGWTPIKVGEMTAIVYVDMAGLKIMVSIDPSGKNGTWEKHISFSRDDRYPSWDEMKNFLYGAWFMDPNKEITMILPPKNLPQQYVNEHQNCFHWWQEE